MLTGKDLGSAIEKAIELKDVSKAEVARTFKVTPPSVQDWIKRGTIDKSKLPKLWKYFENVVGPEHWGLVEFPPMADDWPFPGIDDFAARYDGLASMERGEIQHAVRQELERIENQRAKRSGKLPPSQPGASPGTAAA